MFINIVITINIHIVIIIIVINSLIVIIIVIQGQDIVVVIGMLHCNGVARWLLSGFDPLEFNKAEASK